MVCKIKNIYIYTFILKDALMTVKSFIKYLLNFLFMNYEKIYHGLHK